MQIAPSTYYQVKSRPPSVRTVRDEELVALILSIYDANYQVYGARKIWQELGRQGHEVARCTVERLMRRIGIRGVSRAGPGGVPRWRIGPLRRPGRTCCAATSPRRLVAALQVAAQGIFRQL